ncbi:hypothetical protein IKO70_00115 [bacterium]|nr:hypothetical protein [bacterium]
MRNMVEKINKIPLWAAFLIYELLITVRIFIEMGAVMPSIFIMQLFWFDCVLMFFVIGFKYLLKLKNKDLSVLALGGFLTYIPIFYSLVMHHKWRLNFINPVSFKQMAFDMLTLLAFHEYDWPMFPELIALLTGSFMLALILSGKPFKSLLAALFSLYSSFFCLGFTWFAVNPKHPSRWYFSSPLPDHVTYSIFYGLFFAILVFAAFFREILCFVRKNLKNK